MPALAERLNRVSISASVIMTIKARALAAKHDIHMEAERMYDGSEYYTRIIVWGQPDVCDDEERDPFYGDHYADDWADALERVQEYAKLAA